MCLLAVLFGVLPEAPILVAANREERFDRPASPPALQPGRPRVLCPTDRQAGGTWLGVNEHGVLAAVTNRKKSTVPPAPRSRGLLCREILACRSAAEAAQRAFAELGRGRYAGANYLCLDRSSATIVHGGDRHSVLDLTPGLHVITNGDVDDADDERLGLARRLFERSKIVDVEGFLELARAVCSDPRILIRRPDGGTVSSQLLALTTQRERGVYLHAAGPPDQAPYEDLSDLLRAVRDLGSD